MLLFGLIFLLLRLLYISEQLAGGPYLNFCTANHCTMITRARSTSGQCRLHKGCFNSVDLDPINSIIAYHCDYLSNYCDYSETQNRHLVGYLMCKIAQDQQAITHHPPRPIIPVQAQDHAEQYQQYRSS